MLPESPTQDGLKKGSSGRRPADAWLPRGASGSGEAFDFAVTSGMQSDLFRLAADQPETVFARYEQLKRDFKNTARTCTESGFLFVPVVFESHAGGWSPLARRSVDWISRQQAAAHHEDPAAVALRIAQRISATLFRESARAVLRRLPPVCETLMQPSGWDAVVDLDTSEIAMPIVSLVCAGACGPQPAARDIRLSAFGS